jgi:hypothetical protein
VDHLFIKARILMHGWPELRRPITLQPRNTPVCRRRWAPRRAAFWLRDQIAFVQLRGIRGWLVFEVVAVHLCASAGAAVRRQ